MILQSLVAQNANTSNAIQTNAVNENLLVDGAFNFWYESTSQTSSGYGSDTMWINNHSGSTKTHTRGSFDVGQTVVPGNPRYYSSTQINSVAGANNWVAKATRIVDVATLAGKTVTLSFWARSSVNNKNIATSFQQLFASGNSTQQLGGKKHQLSTEWQKFTHTFTLPTIVGTNPDYGTNSLNCTTLSFWLDSGSSVPNGVTDLGQMSATVDIATVKLEFGSVATEFYHNSIEEIEIVSRYYERIPQVLAMTATAANQTFSIPLQFKVKKRSTNYLITILSSVAYTNSKNNVFDCVYEDGCRNYVVSNASGLVDVHRVLAIDARF